MAATEPIDLGPIKDELLKGLDVKSRGDGSVHSVKAGGRTVAEVCVGARKVRLNLRGEAPKGKVSKGITLEGKSKSWAGGGVIVTADNVKQARALLTAVVAAVPASEPVADDAGGSSAAARQAVQRTTARRTSRKTRAAA